MIHLKVSIFTHIDYNNDKIKCNGLSLFEIFNR